MSQVAIVIQARLSSTRLPQKVLRPIGGRAMVLRLADRMRLVGVPVVVAIPYADDRLRAVCERDGLMVVKGPEEDLVTRLRLAAEAVQAEAIIRATADCPMLCPKLVAEVIREWQKTPTLDYLSNVFPDRTWPDGEDCELYTTNLLRVLEEKHPAAQPSPAEFVWAHHELLNYGTLPCPYGALGHLRWTVDTYEDFRAVQTPFARLPEGFSVADVLTEYGPISMAAMKDITRGEMASRAL